MPSLHLEAVSKHFGGLKAVNDITMVVPQGEMVALIGSNGAGKSTLLNALSNVVKRQQGEIVFAGADTRGLNPHAVALRGLLHVPEGRQILSDMSVFENLQVGQIALGGRATRYTLADVYELFPVLEERRDQIAGTLSGGRSWAGRSSCCSMSHRSGCRRSSRTRCSRR